MKGSSFMLDNIALVLAIIGGLNWGSVGLFQFDFVAWIFGGADSILSRIVYTLVAISAVWCISLLFKEKTPVTDSSDGYSDM